MFWMRARNAPHARPLAAIYGNDLILNPSLRASPVFSLKRTLAKLPPEARPHSDPLDRPSQPLPCRSQFHLEV